MTNIKNNICPYCNKKLGASKDTVVCSYCGIAHHEKCWVDNNGCSTVDCSGNVKKFLRESSVLLNKIPQTHYDINNAQSNKGVYCSSCGQKNLNSDVFCSNCGINLTAVNAENIKTEEIDKTPQYAKTVMSDPEALYIKKKAFYYKYKFDTMRTKNTVYSWNWAAALFSPAWIIYRKMYRLGFGLLIIAHVVQLFFVDYLFVFSLTTGFYMGLKGNGLYMNQIDKLTAESASMNKLERLHDANKKGGVSVVAVLFALIFSFIVAVVALDL